MRDRIIRTEWYKDLYRYELHQIYITTGNFDQELQYLIVVDYGDYNWVCSFTDFLVAEECFNRMLLKDVEVKA